MNTMNFERVNQSHKKLIKQFYKQEKYSASYMGLDHVFIAQVEQETVGAIIISQISKANNQYLLHGFVIKQCYRKAGIGKELHHYAIASLAKDKNYNKKQNLNSIICFADECLSNFYIKLGYKSDTLENLNNTLTPRYNAYKKRQNQLTIFSQRIISK